MNPSFNTRITPKTADSIRMDSVRFNRSVDSLADFILSDFYANFSMKERERMFQALPAKRSGRPTKSKP